MNDKIENVDEIVKIVMENEDVQEALRYAVLDKNKEMLIKQRGMEEAHKETAKKMKNKGKAVEEIIEFTGLTKAEIEEL